MLLKDSPRAGRNLGRGLACRRHGVGNASFRIGESTVLASDCHCAGHASFQGISLSLTVPSGAAAEVRRSRSGWAGLRRGEDAAEQHFLPLHFGWSRNRFWRALDDLRMRLRTDVWELAAGADEDLV